MNWSTVKRYLPVALFVLAAIMIIPTISQNNDADMTDREAKIRYMLEPTVGVDNPLRCGSGTIIKNEKTKVYVLTNRHVLGDGGSKSNDIKVFSPNKLSPDIYTSSVLFESKEYDLAILVFNGGDREFRPIIFKPEGLSLGIFDDIVVYAAGLCETPTIGSGMITGTEMYNDMPMIRTNTMMIPGMSGGGIFVRDGNRYVMVSVCLASWPKYPQLNVSVPVEYILAWFEEIGFKL